MGNQLSNVAEKPAIRIIDDNQDLADILADRLSDEGFQVLQAVDGKGALRILESVKTGRLTILLDLTLPDMTGDQLRTETSKLPVGSRSVIIAMSGSLVIDEAQFSGVLRKPFEFAEVLSLVSAHGGSVEVRSDEAEGSTFKVRLPRST